jgi:hypothetical protein
MKTTGPTPSSSDMRSVQPTGQPPLQPDQASSRPTNTLPDELTGAAPQKSSALPPRKRTDFDRAKPFGEGVAVLSSYGTDTHPHEPANGAMALSWKLIGGPDIGIVSQHKPSHRVGYFPPNLVNAEHATDIGPFKAANTVFMLDTDMSVQPAEQLNRQLMDNAPHLGNEATVVLTGMSPAVITENMAFLHALRPDLKLFGHSAPISSTGQEPQNYNRSVGPIEAFRSVSANLVGSTVEIIRILNTDDAQWVADETKLPVKSGTAMMASFDKAGNLDRELFRTALQENAEATKGRLSVSINAQASAQVKLTTAAAQKVSTLIAATMQSRSDEGIGKMPGTPVISDEVQLRINSLGPVVVVGGTGNIGGAIAQALGGKVQELITINRTLGKKPFDHLGTPELPVREQKDFKNIDPTSTVFVTASVDWRRDDKGEIVFDRNALIGDNTKALLPTIKQLHPDARKVVIISNPCSELTAVVAFLRPDLTKILLAHAGTDAVRSQLRNPTRSAENPNPSVSLSQNSANSSEISVTTPSQNLGQDEMPKSAIQMARDGWQPAQAVVGPHAPEMVVAYPVSKHIDPEVSVLGKTLADEAGGRSVTDPTALSAIDEASGALLGLPGSYAQVLTAKEASELTALMTRWGVPLEVPTGIAPTLPRDNQGAIDWNMLNALKDSVFPGEDSQPDQSYTSKVFHALKTMANNFDISLNCIAELVREKNPGLDETEGCEIDKQWVLNHQEQLLTKYL